MTKDQKCKDCEKEATMWSGFCREHHDRVMANAGKDILRDFYGR